MSERPEIQGISELIGEVRREFVETRATMAEKSAAGEAIRHILTKLRDAGYAVNRRGVLRVVYTTTARDAFLRLMRTCFLAIEEARRDVGKWQDRAPELTDEELGSVLDTVLTAVDVFPIARLVKGRLRSFAGQKDDAYWIEPSDGGPDLRLQDLFPEGADEIELAIAGNWSEQGSEDGEA